MQVIGGYGNDGISTSASMHRGQPRPRWGIRWQKCHDHVYFSTTVLGECTERPGHWLPLGIPASWRLVFLSLSSITFTTNITLLLITPKPTIVGHGHFFLNFIKRTLSFMSRSVCEVKVTVSYQKLVLIKIYQAQVLIIRLWWCDI